MNKRVVMAALKALTVAAVSISCSALHANTSKPDFRVIAFFTGKQDQAHISFLREAERWFPEMATKYNFGYDTTSNWDNLNSDFLASYQVVVFLDTRPEKPAQRAAFRRYMENGGAWMGFHFAGFALTPSVYPANWDWYHNTFLGAGQYASNTWRPTSAILRVEDPKHPATAHLPTTFKSSPSEWYRWEKDLRRNPDIDILLSVDSTSFPLGTGPKQHEIWRSGYYPVVWTNRNYRMIYFNVGHNDIDYEHKYDSTNKTLSYTLNNPIQDRLIVDALLWLGDKGRNARRDVPVDLTRAGVLRVMTAAADWQLANPSKHPPYDWTVAAFYTGMMAFSKVSDSPKYYDAMKAMGVGNQWRPGLRPAHADDHAVIATYARIFQREKDKTMLAPSVGLLDFLVTRPYNEPLTWGNGIEGRELAWCDALFMAPPAFAAVTNATGERKYLDLANRLWWKTTDFLYDTSEHLYFRDSRFFDQREPNGKKIFWSRGNGWVFAGLARMLEEMPGDYPDRPRYVALFRAMAEKVAAVQGADGYWRSSLLDPASRPNPETSGTGFFVFGLAWGINHGLLDRGRYEPAVTRGWTAIVKAVHPNGMLGWVQRIGDQPGATTAETTEVYGVGALLLAGSEVYALAK